MNKLNYINMTNSHILSEGCHMNIVYPNLNQRMIENGVSISDLARILVISEVMVEKKMQGLLPWKLPEAIRICLYLNYPDAKDLFVQFVQLDSNTY